MTRMSSYTIERDIEIDAPVDVVWRTITEPDQIRTWFSDVVELDARPGAVGALTFRAGTNDPLVVGITVVAAERPHRFSFRWCYPAGENASAANSTLVTFTLTATGDARTRLRVVESGLDQLDWPDADKQNFVDQHQHGWQERGDALRDLFAGRRETSR
jgi:uncharacterized protein YndB with AHSA1/START domain